MLIRTSHFKCALLLASLLITINVSGEPLKKDDNDSEDNTELLFMIAILIIGGLFIIGAIVIMCYLGIKATTAFDKAIDLDLKLAVLRAKAEDLRINIIGLETEKTAYETHNEEFIKVSEVDHERVMKIIEAMEKQKETKSKSSSEQDPPVIEQSRREFEARISIVKERAICEHQRYMNLLETTMTDVEFSQELRKAQARDRARFLKAQKKAEKMGRLARLKRMMQIYKKRKELDVELGDRNNTAGVSRDQTNNSAARRLTEANEQKSQIERLQLEVHDGRSENEITESAKEIGPSTEFRKNSEVIRAHSKKDNAIETSDLSKPILNVKPKGNCVDDTEN